MKIRKWYAGDDDHVETVMPESLFWLAVSCRAEQPDPTLAAYCRMLAVKGINYDL